MKKLKIMHGFSEVAGQGIHSVRGLRELNETAEMVVWQPNRFGYAYDRTLNIDRNKKALLPVYGIKLLLFFIYSLMHYNVFHFHFGRSFLLNRDLKILKLFHKKVFFEFHGSDIRDNEIAYKRNPYFNFPFDKKAQERMNRQNEKICKEATGIIIHDYELFAYLPNFLKEVYYVPLRLDISALLPSYPKETKEKVTIVHAPSNAQKKGTEHVVRAIGHLEKKYPIEFILVQDKTQKEARELYAKADIIVDQLYAGTYGVFAIEGMALGKPVITYIMDEMLGMFPPELPIQSASAKTVQDVLERLILSPQLRREIGMAGRKYVEDYHDYRKVAAYLRKIYWGRQACVSSREAFLNVKEMFVQTKD